MKNYKPTKAKFHIGIMAGGKVYSSVNEAQGFSLEMWPMGIFVKGPGVSTVVTYNNVISFDVEEEKAAVAAPPVAPQKTLKAAK